MHLFQQLNPEQLEAVQIVEGPALVLAGAGSGKTRVVTFRIVNLLEIGIPASAILGLTFTNKAASEMKERVRGLTERNVLISTFHSLGARILRESIHFLGYKRDFTIYDDEDIDKILKVCLKNLNLDDKKEELKYWKSLFSQVKNSLSTPERLKDKSGSAVSIQQFQILYSCYQKKLQECNAVDFDDLLYLPVRLFKEHPDVLARYQERWPFLLIDEYQDTNEAQYTFLRLLAEKSHNLFVVGDPDQSIYSWRGANIRNILQFEQDYPGAKVIRLEQNYRSRTNILDAANALIRRNKSRYEKTLRSDLGPGEKIKLYRAHSEGQEAEFVVERIRYYHEKHQVPLSQIVVFYRTNFQSRIFEDQFLSRRIPYVIVGGISFYQRKEIKDILSYLRVIYSGADVVSFLRTINLPKRGLGEATLEKILAYAVQSNQSILTACHSIVEGKDNAAALKLGTRQNKGLSEYLSLVRELKEIAKSCSLKTLVQTTIENSGYLDYLREDRENFEERKGNLDALITKANEWEAAAEKPSLEAFLEELSLKSSLDEASSSKERVHLMTLHNGKGLEFTLTFLVGMEEGLFPHLNALDNVDSLEEERRLCYVGITRAKEYLYLSFCRQRMLWGITRQQNPSTFIFELPEKHIEEVRSRIGASSPTRISRDIREENIVEEPFGDEQVVVAPKSDAPKTHSIGDAVYHREFGAGIIRDVYNGSVGLTYKIIFTKDSRERNIVAKYAILSNI